MTRISTAFLAAVAIATMSTIGDFIWANWIPEHRTIYGLVHGTILFVCLGLVLGVLNGRPAAGALGGAAIGLLGAAAFYLLSPFMGFSAMFLVWFGVWIGLAALYARPWTRSVAARGLIAALASGLAFYSISGIWRPFNPQGWDYAVHFAAWTLAYFPGFAALLVGHPYRAVS